MKLYYEMTREEIEREIEEIESRKREEYEANEEYCMEQGWPGNGSNYELMCEQTDASYEDDLDYLYERLSQLDEG